MEPMSAATATYVLGLMGTDRSPAAIERTARYLRDSLRIGGIKACREIVREAVAIEASRSC